MVNWEAVGAIAELLGAIGVIATLIYLASQIRQNTKALYRNEMNVAMEQWSSFRILMLSNPTFGDVFSRGIQDLASLSREERLIHDNLLTELMQISRHTYHRSKEGVVGMEEWEQNSKPHLAGVVRSPGFKAWWHENKSMFPDDFVAEVEDL